MKILLIEPFFTGSHKSWAEGFQKFSEHQVHLLTLPGRHWKWRMAVSSLSLANTFIENQLKPDLILATDMLDLSRFAGLTSLHTFHIPKALYFHENQITYPWSSTDLDPELERDHHYGFINIFSALVADRVYFNSTFHRDNFLEALPCFLDKFPGDLPDNCTNEIAKKSKVLRLGIDLKKFDKYRPENRIPGPPRILWNHRWEYDKNPEEFFEVLIKLKTEGHPFELFVVGESYSTIPDSFIKAQKYLGDRIKQYGSVSSFETYAKILWHTDLIPVTSRQDFFGISTVEAIYCGNYPILPNRLAFPEHLAPNFHKKNLYSNKSELHEKILSFITNFHSLAQTEVYQNFVEAIDWTILAPQYDLELKTLCKEKQL